MKLPIKLTLCLLLFSLQSFSQVWTEVGPVHFPVLSGYLHGTGRVQHFAFHSTDSDKIYALTRYGGIYSTSDHGDHWATIGTDVLPPSYLSSFCVDPSNDQIIYVAACDNLFYLTNNTMYKTLDGGHTWSLANNGLANVLAIDMIIDSLNTQRIIVETNNGIWRTLDGGANWSVVKGGGRFRHMMQVPGTRVLMAVTETAVWRSDDFGDTWTEIYNPDFILYIGDGMRVCVNSTQPNIVYVVGNGDHGFVFKSTDMGLTFSLVYHSDTKCLVCYDSTLAYPGQGNYNFAACCDPTDPNHLYMAAHCIWESNDGGVSWEQKTSSDVPIHTDHSQLLFSPHNPAELWISNDGGIFQRSGLNDSAWTMKNDGIGAMEVWHVAASPNINHQLSIGTQDNGGLDADSIGWYNTMGGDQGGLLAYDYTPSNYVYYLSAGTRKSITPPGFFTGFNIPSGASYYTKIAFHPSHRDLALIGHQDLWMTNNLGNSLPSWTLVNSVPDALMDVVISAADANIAYHLTTSSLFRIDNLLSTPVVTELALPITSYFTGSLCTVKNDVNVVYLTLGYNVFRSNDQGLNWTDVTGNLPNHDITQILSDDYNSTETIYLQSGDRYTDTKIFRKQLTDSLWQDWTGNLPTVATVTDMEMYNDGSPNSKLYVSTMGRGVWSCDLYDTTSVNIEHPFQEDLGISVYPNPATKNFFVKNSHSKEYTIKVFSTEGVLQYEQKSNLSLLTVDCHSFSEGTYVYLISSAGITNHGKLIIVK